MPKVTANHPLKPSPFNIRNSKLGRSCPATPRESGTHAIAVGIRRTGGIGGEIFGMKLPAGGCPGAARRSGQYAGGPWTWGDF